MRRSRPPHCSISACAGRHHHAADAEEQKPFEHGVIQDVQQTGRHGPRSQFAVAEGQGHHAGAQREDDDPDVLDRAVGQEPFQIGLSQAYNTPRTAESVPRAMNANPQRTSGTPRPKAQTLTSP